MSEPLAPQTARVVIDTNIVLDAFVFNDPATQPLLLALSTQSLTWIATQAMRDELERVLDYPKIVARLLRHDNSAQQVLAQFDAQARLVETALKAELSCSDPDDQKFIDLAVANQTLLLSKDEAILCMKKRLLKHAVRTQTAI